MRAERAKKRRDEVKDLEEAPKSGSIRSNGISRMVIWGNGPGDAGESETIEFGFEIVDSFGEIVASSATITVLGQVKSGKTTLVNAMAGWSEDHEPVLVLCDLTLPGDSGIDLTRWLHARRPELPVILCSGRSDPTADLAMTGNVTFLAKPFLPNELLHAVERAFDDAV